MTHRCYCYLFTNRISNLLISRWQLHSTLAMLSVLCWKMQIMPIFISSSSNKCFFPSQCSKTCGRGIKKRDVYCKSTGSPEVKILPESMCSTDPKPESQQTCVLGRCPKNDRLQWVISSWSEVKWCSFVAHCLPWLLLGMLAQGHTQTTGRKESWAVFGKSGVVGEVL